MIDTLPDRIALAATQSMPFEELLTLMLTDEIARRDTTAVDNRVAAAKLDPDMCIERFDKRRQDHLRSKTLQRAVLASDFCKRIGTSSFSVPSGVGKTFIANTLGHLACRHRFRRPASCAPT